MVVLHVLKISRSLLAMQPAKVSFPCTNDKIAFVCSCFNSLYPKHKPLSLITSSRQFICRLDCSVDPSITTSHVEIVLKNLRAYPLG